MVSSWCDAAKKKNELTHQSQIRQSREEHPTSTTITQLQDDEKSRLLRTLKATSMTGKRLFLLTDERFLFQLAVNLTGMVSAVVLCAKIPLLAELTTDVYFQINDWMLQTAHRYAWWSLLGLLSSSCCALQLLLNAMSMGCAGFNAVLGPMRPTLLSLTIVVQVSSWYVAWSRAWQWYPTAVSTVLVLSTSLLPEILQLLYSSRRSVLGATSSSSASYPTSTTPPSDDDTTCCFKFHMTSVGCSACIVTVSAVLEKLAPVRQFHASMEDDACLTVICDRGTNQQLVLDTLEEAGFPMEPF